MKMLRKSIFLVLLVTLLWNGHAFAWSFAVCGDSRDDRDGIFPQILSAVDTSDMEFLLHTGDMVNKDSPGEWSEREPRALWGRDTGKVRGEVRPLGRLLVLHPQGRPLRDRGQREGGV